MSDDKPTVSQNVCGRSLTPFTGPVFAIWAFFSPEGFGAWFGTVAGVVVKTFRAVSGI